MNNKVKGGLSIFFMSLSFYMMITTKYARPLGDYVLEFIGLPSWTGDYTGFHLTIIYFWVLFIIGLSLVKKYARDGLNMKKRRVFLVFIGLIVVFNTMTGATVKTIKKNSPGLLSIGYNSENGRMSYESRDYEFTQFVADFELTNYSDEKKTFHIGLDNSSYEKDGFDSINFYLFDGNQATFELEAGQTTAFSLSLDDYHVTGGRKHENGSGNGTIQQVILTNDKGDRVKLDRKDFIGIDMNR